MGNKKFWAVFLPGAAALIAILLLVSLNVSRDKEKRLRVQKELELSNRMIELAEKEATISDLLKQKTDLEQRLVDKVSEMEAAVRNQQSINEAQKRQLDSAVGESSSLRKEIEDKNRKITDLLRRIDSLEADKNDLVAAIKKLETEKPAESSVDSSFRPAYAGTGPAVPQSGTGAVQLGDIVVRRSSGGAAQVQHVNAVYGFIVINAGSGDGIKNNDVVNILRDDKLVARAVVQKVRGDISAALVLPEWSNGDVRPGDLVSRY
ncbi:MAG: hypothetical protein MOGMAGMI_00966 [Candidatus Omnitrophica bacterium]|nr:hypothetical protein [Candidatus Omnitrophota bacterium]